MDIRGDRKIQLGKAFTINRIVIEEKNSDKLFKEKTIKKLGFKAPEVLSAERLEELKNNKKVNYIIPNDFEDVFDELKERYEKEFGESITKVRLFELVNYFFDKVSYSITNRLEIRMPKFGKLIIKDRFKNQSKNNEENDENNDD